MLNRLYLGIHWIIFLAFFGIWALFLLSLMIGSPDKVLDDLRDLFIGDHGFQGILFSGAMTWIPVGFFLIDYITNGKWIWFPWQRDND